MSVRLDDGTNLGEDQKKIFKPWTAQNQFFFFFFFFIYKYIPIKGMDEMSVQLDDGTNFGEAFFLLATVCPD